MDFETAERAKEREAERAQAREQAERAKLTLLGAMAHKYGCDADYDEVIAAMAERDKYFVLGYWLFRNRNSWHDGPERARCGLDLFNVGSDEDRLVYDDIAGRIDRWDGAGTVMAGCSGARLTVTTTCSVKPTGHRDRLRQNAGSGPSP